MAEKKTFINNNTFAGYLYSRGMVQHFHLDLPGNTHLFQPSRWYDMTLPSWALTFPMLGSLQYAAPFLIPSLLALMALTSRWCRTLTWACVDNMSIELWHFLFALQLNLNSFLIAHHCCSEWKSSSSVLGIRFPEESQPWPHKSLKNVSPLWTYEVWSDMSKGHVTVLLSIFSLHHPTSS